TRDLARSHCCLPVRHRPLLRGTVGVTLAHKVKFEQRNSVDREKAKKKGADRRPSHWCASSQRLENWKRRRAPARPYFLRSTTRLSRVGRPLVFMALRRAGSNLASACAMPCRTAPAWPDRPPPETVAMTSNWPWR